jgi:ribonuclease HII
MCARIEGHGRGRFTAQGRNTDSVRGRFVFSGPGSCEYYGDGVGMNPALRALRCLPDYRFEEALAKAGVRFIAGIDEAGRGCLAGPVVAAAVVLSGEGIPEGVTDSKRLTPRVRLRLYGQIRACAVAVGVGSASSLEIDTLGVWRATCLAAQRALAVLPVAVGHVLMDGMHKIPELTIPQTAICKGDQRCASIAAASIVAKVRRDRMMCVLDRQFPGYGFATHKGYATPQHRQFLRTLGPCRQHRRSFTPVLQLELW